MLWRCVLWIVLFRINIALAEYECHTSGRNVSCKALTDIDLKENLTVVLTNDESSEIQELYLEDSVITSIKKYLFDNFKNINNLTMRNTSSRTIEEGAFSELPNLKKVILTDNYLQEINSNAFPANNLIETLDLSRNLLNNLDNFDITLFPALTLMNISYNKLEYLPENILHRLTEEKKFYLVIDNNPWNCLHSSWGLQLSEILVTAFCSNNIYDPTDTDRRTARMEYLEYSKVSKNGTDDTPGTFECMKYSLKSCLFWALAAVWIGIILGNTCKIKRLLFSEPTRYEDKNTQCEFSWREPFLREEFSKLEAVKQLNQTSKPNIPKVA